jgi:inosine-uridine nucleoside N-ribohydrolase
MFDWGHGCVLYDPLAVAVAADQTIGTFEALAASVETTGTLSLGQTVPIRDAPTNMRVCVGVDGPRVVRGIVDIILAI